MSGVRKDGILQTDDQGAGAPVTITSPIGPNVKADSVSVTLATDEGAIPVSVTALPSISATDTLTFNGDVVDITVPDGYNTLLAWISDGGGWLGGGVQFKNLQGATVIGNAYALNLDTGIRSIFVTPLAGANFLVAFPVVPGQVIRFTTIGYAGGTANIVTILSTSIHTEQPLTNQELRAANVTVDLAATSNGNFVVDNYTPSSMHPFQAFPMVYNTTFGQWDRLRGDTNGLLVTFGASTPTVNTELPAAALAVDNFANPTTPNIMSMGMLFDGATWDRARGDSVDGALVNLGANNDVRITDGINIAGITNNGGIFGLDTHSSVVNGAVPGALTPVWPVGGTDINSLANFMVNITNDPSLALGGRGFIEYSNQAEPNIVSKAWPTKITDGVDTALVTTGGGLHSNLRDDAGNEINSSQLNSASITNTDRALETKSVMFIRNTDGTVTTWAGDTAYSGFASNNYPSIKAFRTSIQSGDTSLNALNAQFIIDLKERSLESAVLLLRTSSLVGTISILAGASTNTVIPVYNFRTQAWQTGTITNPTLDTHYGIPCAGFGTVIIRVTAYTSGSVIGSYEGGPGINALFANITGSEILTDALVTEAETDRALTSGNNSIISQTTQGFLRTLIGALVSSDPKSYTDGEVKPLSITALGRLRVSSVESMDEKFPFGGDPWAGVEAFSLKSPWES